MVLQRPTVEVTGHKAHGAVPEPGSVVIARVSMLYIVCLLLGLCLLIYLDLFIYI